MTSNDLKLHDGFDKGIRFSCQGCGRCCKGFEGGDIYIYQNDVKRIFNYFKLRTEAEMSQFAEKFFRIVDDTFKIGISRSKTFKTLAIKIERGKEEKCIFLKEDNSCQIYSARPYQCSSFPFWRMVVSDEKRFISYKRDCLALDSNTESGKNFSVKKIKKLVKKEYKLERRYYNSIKDHGFDITKIYSFLKN